MAVAATTTATAAAAVPELVSLDVEPYDLDAPFFFVSAAGTRHQTTVRIARTCEKVRCMLDMDASGREVALADDWRGVPISDATIEHVLEWCTHHRGIDLVQPDDLTMHSFAGICADPWDAAFFNRIACKRGDLYALINAAHALGIVGITWLGSARVAAIIRDCEVHQLAARLDPLVEFPLGQ